MNTITYPFFVDEIASPYGVSDVLDQLKAYSRIPESVRQIIAAKLSPVIQRNADEVETKLNNFEDRDWEEGDLCLEVSGENNEDILWEAYGQIVVNEDLTLNAINVESITARLRLRADVSCEVDFIAEEVAA